jgi:hypothetical protein
MPKCQLLTLGVPCGALDTARRRGILGLCLATALSLSHCGGEGRSLDALTPSVGSVLGGEEVVLSGHSLDEPPRVLLGGMPAASVQVESPQQLRLRLPPSAVRGEQTVSALWADGLLLSLEERFTYHALQLDAAARALPRSHVLAASGLRRASGAGAVVDLVLATDDPLALHRLAGDGNGHFTWQNSQPLRGLTTALLATDLDSDGLDDVVVAEGARQTLSLWLGQADGSWRSGGEVGVGCAVASLAAADLLGDGRPDLAVGCRDASSIAAYVFENRWPDGAAARFAAPQVISLPGSIAVGTVQVVAADLTGGGRATLAATLSRRGGLVLFQPNGMGGLTMATTLPTGNEPGALLAADLNGDARADLVSVDRGGGSLSYYLSPESGLPTRQSWPLPPGYERPVLAALDWDGDGRGRELIVGATPGIGDLAPVPLQPLRLNAQGQLQALPTIADMGEALHILALPLATGAPPALLALSDDGATLRCWPKPSVTPQPVAALPPPHSLVTADLTSDGHIDAAWLLGGRVALLITDEFQSDSGSGELPTPRFVDLSGPRDAPRVLFAADLNGDWFGDLVVGDGRGLQILLARQPAQFQPAIYVDLGVAVDSLSVADVNDDGRPDVVAASASQAAIYVLLGNGNGTLQTAQRLALATTASADGIRALRVVDQDGDGHRDILALSGSQLHIVRGQDRGRLAAPFALTLPIAATTFAVPDLDFDGRRDVVASSAQQSGLVVLRARADGSLVPAQILASDVPLPSLVVDDLDRDGQLDVAAVAADTGKLRVFLGRDGGTLLPHVRVEAGQPTLAKDAMLLPRSFDLASLDLSGDAERDLFVLGQGAYQVLRRAPPR